MNSTDLFKQKNFLQHNNHHKNSNGFPLLLTAVDPDFSSGEADGRNYHCKPKAKFTVLKTKKAAQIEQLLIYIET